ncbi:PLP-dependent aminotransferase family protein [Mycolicibacterium setense]|uniref:MocR-like pyridoxine biosynthesis transcription factor PdxR n=1 Tax=Mycolicibacterium setense TaxID=431269 RepID=UPI000574FFA0|nr:PLP-dependent aminotransferase family protein [Mycolicibacterium setense]KHO23212.1 GntR family transcriptional regulator [Mycolicibacterium setense]MCV7115254.1 PLP-dependent aminotransferase family protein [Mycolicibacterium setense]
MDQVARDAVGADFLQLDPATAPARGLTDWLADALRSAIADGRLAPGTRCPATRVLAGELAVSRGVVVEAYRRLADEGLIGGRAGGGSHVLTRPVRPPQPEPTPAPSVSRLPRPRLPVGEGIDLSPGVPDLSAFPRSTWLRAERAVLAEAAPEDLGYGDPRGHPRLRAALAPWLGRTRGLRIDADEILVVAGVAQAVALLAQQLRDEGLDTIAVEDPGSRGAVDELEYWGLRPVPVPVDGDGIVVSELSATGAPTVFLTPAHQFPTGVVLSPQRRRELLEWNGELIIEDDYDAEYRYDRAPVPALHPSAPDRIAYAGSTSKSLAPALRLGWLTAPPQRRPDLVTAKHATDLGSPTVPQLVLARLLESGEYDRHVRLVRARHRARRDALLDVLATAMPAATVTGVAAGLHLLVTLPEDVDDVALADDLRDAGVLVHPVSWHRRLPGPPGLVLGYASHPPDRLRDAASTIAHIAGRRS